jgi:hypothetical protein
MNTSTDMLDPVPSAFDRLAGQYPQVAEWLKAGESNFARSLAAGLIRYGSLTERQLAAAIRIAAEPKAKPAQAARPTVDVAGGGFTALLAAFKRARSSGLKHPALTFEAVTFKLASESSKNPGCLYVTGGKAYGSDYFGKVSPAGVFSPSGACPASVQADVARIGLDPLGESVKHGKRTGSCACCNRPLSDPKSVYRGIGPICFEKFFGG